MAVRDPLCDVVYCRFFRIFRHGVDHHEPDVDVGPSEAERDARRIRRTITEPVDGYTAVVCDRFS